MLTSPFSALAHLPVLLLSHVSRPRYNISWTADSHVPIEDFKLFFRRLPQGHEIDNGIDQLPAAQEQDFPANRNYGNLMQWSQNEWHDVVLPSLFLSQRYTQSMSYMIRGLVPGQRYEVCVQSR